MSEELKRLREATEVKAKTFDREKWASRPVLFELPYEWELPNSNNISNTDSIRGEGRGTYIGYDQLRGMVLYLQSKLNEHLDKSKTKVKREW